MRGLLLVCALSVAALAQVDPDTQAARRHFERGRALYEEGRYDDAVSEFETARKLKPLPELLFNLGRTHERREDWRSAADAYEKYLQEKPDAADAEELRGRIGVLRARTPMVTAAPAPLASSARPRPLRRAAVGVLIGAVVLAGVGSILIGTVGSDFQDLERQCDLRQCGPSDWSGLKARADAGYAFLGLAGAAVIADLALWIVDARHPNPTQARLVPAGLGVGGVF